MEEKNNSSKPHVTLFGKDMDSTEEKKEEKKERNHRIKHKHHCDCGDDCNCDYHGARYCKGTNFGLVILSAGVILILNTLGVVSWDFWQYASSFWPAFLILLGIKIFLGHNIFARAITWLLTLMILFFVIAYSLMRTGVPIENVLPQGTVDFINSFNINI